MDLQSQFALMAKATNVFSSEDTFLSFPVTPLVYPREDLDFSGSDVNRIIEFSALTNMIPRGMVWDHSSEAYLWDMYEKVLDQATFAYSTRTADEELSFKLARSLLESRRPDGSSGDSPQFASYHHFQSLYENAVQEYNAQAGTALALTDSEEIRAWTETQEPKLRLEILLAKKRWETAGFKEQVESAKAVIESLGAKSPLVTLSEWKKFFDKNIDTYTRPTDQMVVFPTAIAPKTALQEGSWLPFEISGAEISQLIQEAPAELKERYGLPGSSDSIESIRFEFSSAKLLRPWFRPEVFKARFWRFADDLMFSDGKTPPEGVCPYYAVAVVFARNIALTSRKTSQPGGSFQGFRILPELPRLLENMNLQKIPIRKERLDLSRKIRTMPVLDLMNASTRGEVLPAAEKRSDFNAVASRFTTQSRRIPGLSVKTIKELKNQPVWSGPLMSTDVGEKPEPAKPPETVTVADTANIHILAFICRAIPRCPDPDPNLQW